MFPVSQPDPEKEYDDADDLQEGDRFAEKQEGEEEGGGELAGREKTAEAGGDVRHPAAKEERREEDTEEGEGNSVGKDRGKMRRRYRKVGRQKEENHHERAAYHEGAFCDRMDASPDAVHAEKAGGVGNRGGKSPKHAGREGKGGSASDHACGQYSELGLRRCLANSKMLSSDVSSAYDALYASAYDKKNVAYLGRGMVFNKFTGARGKSGSNDANAEYLGEIRRMLEKHDVHFQLAELGRVDLGGGGTIAYIMSLYGMQVIDSGVGVLSMHAPWEATSKVDIYETKKGYMAFLAEA